MPAPRYQPDTLAICRAALARGPLRKVRTKFQALGAKRRFGPETVNALITSGEATRRPDGSVVKADVR